MIKTALPRTVASCLCKTHKWLFVETWGSDVYWSGSPGVTFSGGAERDSLEHMLDVVQSEGHQWALYAVTEPTLPEEEVTRVLDLMFPLQGGAAICGKFTPREQLSELYRYLKKTLNYVGLTGHLRGINSLPEPVLPDIAFDPAPVHKHSLFLCTAKIKAAKLLENVGLLNAKTDLADYIWFNQAISNLFPAKGYFHKLYGKADQYGSYCIAAMEDLDDASVVFDKELNALSTFLASDSANGDNKLYRVIGADSDDYVDCLLCDPSYTNRTITALSTIGKKFIMMNNRAELMPLPDIDITKNATETKRLLLQKHEEDALAPFVALGWEAL